MDLIDVEFGTLGVNCLDEAAHVSALEGGGEVDGEGDDGHGVLLRARFVAESHRKTEIFDSNAIDWYLAVIRFVLGVFEVG